MSNPIVRGFANVARFGGRDTRSQFWPYVGVVVALYVVVGMPLLAAVVMSSAPGAGSSSGAAFLDMGRHFLLVSSLVFVVLVALLAGAVARRLHDAGFSALLGLLPLPFAAFSLVMFTRLFSQAATAGSPDMVLFMSVFVSNALYMAGVVTLIVLLARASKAGPNRYD